MRLKQPFTLYQRLSSSRKSVWYVSWYESTGKRRIRSTGKASRAKAMEAALRITSAPTGKCPTLAEYAMNFYAWDGWWCRRQIAKGRGCNRVWAASRQAMLDNHVLPHFGHLRLDQITRPMIERWLIDLQRSNQTRNHILYTLRTVFAEAESEDLIAKSPLDKVEPLGKKARRRDAFTLEELRKLFPTDRRQLLAIWRTPKYAALYVTLATTGIREGEARALCWRHVLPDGWLFIEQAVKNSGEIGATKSGASRVVPLLPLTMAVLSWWHGSSPFTEPDHLVFFGTASHRPLNRRTFDDLFRRAIATAAIEIGDRFLTTHSFRHTYNSLVRRAVAEDALRQIVGHRDQRMSEYYDHAGPAEMIRALHPVQAQIESAFSTLNEEVVP